MSLSPDKRRFLTAVLGELPVALLETELSRKSRELERSVNWKERKPHPADPFVALLHRERNVMTNSRPRDIINARSPVAPFIGDLRNLMKRETPTVKW